MSIPQRDGTVKRFSEHDLDLVFVAAMDRGLGKKGLRHEPEPVDAAEHPICVAARNSSFPEWYDFLYVQERPEEPIPDLSK